MTSKIPNLLTTHCSMKLLDLSDKCPQSINMSPTQVQSCDLSNNPKKETDTTLVPSLLIREPKQKSGFHGNETFDLFRLHPNLTLSY